MGLKSKSLGLDTLGLVRCPYGVRKRLEQRLLAPRAVSSTDILIFFVVVEVEVWHFTSQALFLLYSTSQDALLEHM